MIHGSLSASVRGLSVLIPLVASAAALGQLPLPALPPVPPENPITEPKRVLGKILFWDEQLSSDNTAACGMCHLPLAGGAERLPVRHPGPDGILNSPDDVFGSAGVIKADAQNDFDRDVAFALNRQVTSRSANSMINAAFFNELFWDGRARGTFFDPQTGSTVIGSGGALESQAVGPIVSDVEMAHADRNWDQVTQKLRSAGPLALATNVPPDAADAIAAAGSYPALFKAAFGDSTITASRIALAIATYERTLVSNQSPWDRFVQGDTTALTAGQQAGWQFFQNSECIICHAPPLFSDGSFRNIGLRPNTDDIGREAVTNLPGDRGRFKTASLRNLATRRNLMHTGQFTTVNQVFPFYAGPGAPGNPNRDPILPSPVPPQQVNAITDFIVNGLTDPRVRNEQFPFDRPTLHVETAPANPALLPGATPGSGGILPRAVAICPPNVGNTGFKIGLDAALPGATARVAISMNPPVAGVVDPAVLSEPIVIEGTTVGAGHATFHWPIEADRLLEGQVIFMQWRIEDPSAAGGIALSNIARLTLFAAGNLPFCRGDADGSFTIEFADITATLANFGMIGPAYRAGDSNGDGIVEFADLTEALARWGETCL